MKYEDLKALVETVKGTTFAGLDTLTSVSLKGGKKNPMQGRVTKRTTNANIMLFSNSTVNGYEAMVKRRMLKEGKDPDTFQVKPRAWGQRVGNSPFIEHNGKYYLECIFVSGGKSEYFLDGQPIEKENIEGLEEPKEKTEETTVDENKPFRNEDLEDKVIIRTFSLDSIERITVKGEELVN
jgi:hypothetical protein